MRITKKLSLGFAALTAVFVITGLLAVAFLTYPGHNVEKNPPRQL